MTCIFSVFLKEDINRFKLKVDQTKFYCFKSNLNDVNTIFGELNLNEFGTRLVSCSRDKSIKIWDLKTFECLRTINGQTGKVSQVEQYLNNQILSCSFDKTIKLWDMDTGVCLKTFNHHNRVSSIKILSEKTFASGSIKEINIWNIDDGRCVKTLNGHKSYVRCMLLLQNGSLVSCSEDKTIKVWDIEQGICTNKLNGHNGMILCLLLLNNGNLVSGSAENGI